MNTFIHPKSSRGQALMELTIVLPLLILFMAVFAPLLSQSRRLPWLDERLALSLSGSKDKQLDSLLSQTHNKDRLPRYFDKTRLEEKTKISKVNPFLSLPGGTFPGQFIRRSITATWSVDKWWNTRLLGASGKGSNQITGSLSLISVEKFTDSAVSARVRKMSFPGLLSGTTGFLERVGIRLFHLDLDTLPLAVDPGG